MNKINLNSMATDMENVLVLFCFLFQDKEKCLLPLIVCL